MSPHGSEQATLLKISKRAGEKMIHHLIPSSHLSRQSIIIYTVWIWIVSAMSSVRTIQAPISITT